MRSIEFFKGLEHATVSAAPSSSSSPLSAFKSDPNIHHKQRRLASLEERPMTSCCVETVKKPSTPEPALVPCPPSPTGDPFPELPLPKDETVVTARSSSSAASMGALTTPLTSPSESASPIYGLNNQMTKEVADRMLAFQSDPSLPALLSSTSSVSADPEGEFLGNPGVVGRPSVIDTTDSLTPPAFAKEPISGFPLEPQDMPEDAVHFGTRRAADRSAEGIRLPASRRGSQSRRDEDDDDDDDDNGHSSDSDEGLTMARNKKKPVPVTVPDPAPAAIFDTHHAAPFPRQPQALTLSVGRLVGNSRRRDTNASVGSTETAKKMFVMDPDEPVTGS